MTGGQGCSAFVTPYSGYDGTCVAEGACTICCVTCAAECAAAGVSTDNCTACEAGERRRALSSSMHSSATRHDAHCGGADCAGVAVVRGQASTRRRRATAPAAAVLRAPLRRRTGRRVSATRGTRSAPRTTLMLRLVMARILGTAPSLQLRGFSSAPASLRARAPPAAPHAPPSAPPRGRALVARPARQVSAGP